MFDRVTEQPSRYDNLENSSVMELLQGMNAEDRSVPMIIGEILPQIALVVEAVHARMANGGRLFYLGSGTSGRLGVVDASECPPTYGVPQGLVVGIIAGGDPAIRKAVEGAEDDPEQGWLDVQAHQIGPQDALIGIAASGTTTYVVEAVKEARSQGIFTACIVCNAGSPLALASEQAIEAVVGPEFVTGSTRMKAGTAQKLILNMISTAVMIRLGHVRGNRMVDMRPTNAKLVVRGTQMIQEATGLDAETAKSMLLRHGSVRVALENR